MIVTVTVDTDFEGDALFERMPDLAGRRSVGGVVLTIPCGVAYIDKTKLAGLGRFFLAAAAMHGQDVGK